MIDANNTEKILKVLGKEKNNNWYFVLIISEVKWLPSFACD